MKLETYVNGFSIAKEERQQTTAKVGDVLEGKTYITGEGSLETGEMTNNAAFNIELEPGETQNIPQGYHNGEGTIKALETAKLGEGNFAFYGGGWDYARTSEWSSNCGLERPIGQRTGFWTGYLNEDYLSFSSEEWQGIFNVKIAGTYSVIWFRYGRVQV